MLRLARTALRSSQLRPIPRADTDQRCSLHTHCCTKHAADAEAAPPATAAAASPAASPVSPAAAPAARPVRVRYAPSPTGSVHLGGLRTALYNYLFAKKAALAASESGSPAAAESGKFLLRIEDTDQKRLVPTAVDELCVALKWAGLQNDEGPGAPTEGDCGPYVQSQRLPIYQQHVQKLLASGHAYPCFCSAERLSDLRDMQLKKGLPSAYDRLCLSLDEPERARRLAEAQEKGTPYVVRMKVPQTGTTNVFDLIRGQVTFLNKTLDDQVLLKSDGFPTYHLACVVDDHLMRISHVIRGDEWLTSTPKHVLLYRAFGWPVPAFAHLPLLLKPDGSKLSKRHADSSLDFYIKRGYLPEALVNFVALLGWNPGSTQEVFSLPELVKAFTVERIQKAGAVVNIAKLDWFNAQHLARMASGGRLNEIVEKVRPLIRAHHSAAAVSATSTGSAAPSLPASLESDLADDAYLSRVVLSLVSHVTHLSDFVSQSSFYYRCPDYASPSAGPDLIALRQKVFGDATSFETNARLVAATVKLLEALPDAAFEMNAPPPPTAPTAAAAAASVSSPAAAAAPSSSSPAASTGPSIQSALKQLIKDQNVKQKTYFLLLRYILSGSESGPSISVIIATLGRQRALQRLRNDAAYTPQRP